MFLICIPSCVIHPVPPLGRWNQAGDIQSRRVSTNIWVTCRAVSPSINLVRWVIVTPSCVAKCSSLAKFIVGNLSKMLSVTVPSHIMDVLSEMSVKQQVNERLCLSLFTDTMEMTCPCPLAVRAKHSSESCNGICTRYSRDDGRVHFWIFYQYPTFHFC